MFFHWKVVAFLTALVITHGSVLSSRDCSFVCPAVDNGNGLLFDQFFTATELVCEYGNRGCGQCEYNRNTGTLDVDGDKGFCPSTATEQCAALQDRNVPTPVVVPLAHKSRNIQRSATYAAIAPRASAGCSYVCPPTDISGNVLFDQFFFAGGVGCDYGSRGCGECQYSTVTGGLTLDADAGFCAQTATLQCMAGTRRATGGVPHAPKRNGTRGEVTKAMKNRSTLRRDNSTLVRV